MSKSPNNYRTLSLYTHHSPLKSYTHHKIPFHEYRFENLICDRLNSDNMQPKSIFFLRGSIKKDDIRYNKDNRQKLPQLTISTTLDSPQGNRKNKLQINQLDKTFYEKNQTKSIQMYRNDSKSKGQNRKRINIRVKFPKKDKELKKQIQLNDIVLGNKTIMNFRPRQQPSQTIHHRKKQLTQHKGHIKKVKFGSFYHSINLNQICPWGFTDRVQQIQGR